MTDTTPTEVTPPAPGAPLPEPTDKPAKQELTPEALRAELDEARNEAAKYRTKLRELEKAQKEQEDRESKALADQGNFKELYEKAAADLKAMRDELTSTKRTNIALEFGLPAELAKRLQGDNEEELRKDAEALKALIPTAQPSQQQQSTSRVTSVPDGKPAGETDEQRRARLFGGATNFFNNPQPIQMHNKK